MRILKTNPILKLLNSYLIDSPQPSNLNYLWNFGSLLALCLGIQILSGVTLAILTFIKYISMFYSVEYALSTDINYIYKYSLLELKQKILDLKKKISNGNLAPAKLNNEDKNYFLEWLRGFTDGEGYFSIDISSRKNLNKNGEIIEYKTVKFLYVLHLAAKDINVLYTIQNYLGGIGEVKLYKGDAFFIVRKREDLDKLIKLMYKYFSKLNTTKVLDFLAWNEARTIYYKFIDERVKDLPLHKDLSFMTLLEKITSIKNSINKSRTQFILPENHKIDITSHWLLGFIEAEGCFYLNNLSIAFKLSQTAINREVLVYIKDYLLKLGNNFIVSIEDCKPNSFNQKPYSVLYVGKGNNTANLFISFLINLPWLSIKVLDFINWTIVYILVSEASW